jgi:hypothetical protein
MIKKNQNNYSKDESLETLLNGEKITFAGVLNNSGRSYCRI